MLQLVAFAFGTLAIRFLHRVRRGLSGSEGYFTFSDFLIEDRVIEHRAFVIMILPPLFGGALLAVWEGVQPATAAAAGFMAAFLGVWPVYRWPLQLLEEHLHPYWKKLRFLYALFVGLSMALAYAGFVVARSVAPYLVRLTTTAAWRQFLDDLAANAIYDLSKLALGGLLFAGGLYANRERNRIGRLAAAERDKDWERKHGYVPAARSGRDPSEGIEYTP